MAKVILEIRGLVYWIGGPADDPGCFHPFAPVLPFLAMLGSLIMRYYAKGIPDTSKTGCIRSAFRREISAFGLETLTSDIVVSLVSGGERTISLIPWVSRFGRDDDLDE